MAEDRTYLVSIQFHAEKVAASAVCAYWDKANESMHVDNLKHHMHEIEKLMDRVK